MPTIGKDVLRRDTLTQMVLELNEHMDGPAPVALRFTRSGPPTLEVVDSDKLAVVHLPGDGRPFPVRAYVTALLVSEVLEENG